jgi:hypothetical protein
MSGNDVLSLVGVIASGATAVGVLLAWDQIRVAKQQAKTQFEDGLAREYREIAQRIPVKALLGEDLDDAEYDKALADLFRYIDLCNEETFLRQNGRISDETWETWCDGIKSHLSRVVFKKAWKDIKSRTTDSFQELRRLEASGFKDDPRSWA